MFDTNGIHLAHLAHLAYRMVSLQHSRANLDSSDVIWERRETKSWIIPGHALSNVNEFLRHLRQYGHEARKAMDLVPWRTAPSLMDMIQLVRSGNHTNHSSSAEVHSIWIARAAMKTATFAKLAFSASFA
ncbi:hypothetical protein PM082_017865 [Marasmius tenuissimus]|nr:hypothetical protein PM082_017865 [Marasmius tenuissimus]